MVDAYALALATCVLTAGALADLFGRKRLFLLGIVLFTVASAACGAAYDPLFLIIARGVQGIGGAMMFATALALLSQEFHGRERGTAFGLWGAVDRRGGRDRPARRRDAHLVALVALDLPRQHPDRRRRGRCSALRQLHESSDPEHSRLDPLGLVTLTVGLFCLILALIEGNGHGWTSAFIVALLVVGGRPAGACSSRRRRASGTTMIDLALFGRPAFVGAQTTAFAISSSMFAMFLYLTLYLQNILGLSPLADRAALPAALGSSRSSPRRSPDASTAPVPIRALLGFGLALNALAMWLDEPRLDARSHWTVLLPGFLDRRRRDRLRERAARDDGGLDRAPRARRAWPRASTTRSARSGSRPASPRSARSSSRSRHRSGGRAHPAAKAAFVHGLHDILLVGAGVAAVGAVLAVALVRRQDFVASGPPPRLRRKRGSGSRELLAHELAHGRPVRAAGDLRHHVRHHAAHVAHVRRPVLGDRVVDDPLELLLARAAPA